jgi:hypothetical protein
MSLFFLPFLPFFLSFFYQLKAEIRLVQQTATKLSFKKPRLILMNGSFVVVWFERRISTPAQLLTFTLLESKSGWLFSDAQHTTPQDS